MPSGVLVMLFVTRVFYLNAIVAEEGERTDFAVATIVAQIYRQGIAVRHLARLDSDP